MVSYITFLVFLLYSTLSNAPIQNLNCFILLERHYHERISFVTSCFIDHEGGSTDVLFFLQEDTVPQITVCCWRHIPYFVVHAAIIRKRFAFHNKLLSLFFSPIIYPIPAPPLKFLYTPQSLPPLLLSLMCTRAGGNHHYQEV